jgi:2'-5' RNA ligase
MRLFVALPLPAAVRREVGELLATLRSELPAARWIPPENLHLTLCFLGEQPVALLDGLRARLRAACRACSSFEAAVGRGGAFPSRTRPRVLWIGFRAPEGALARLVAAVERACDEAGAPQRGGARHDPHVTVARCRRTWSAPTAGLWDERVPASLGPPFTVRHAVLFESRPASRGVRYHELAHCALGAAA